jgi:pimeloyl-ACP methyl ester carboxylesterase
MSNVTANGIQIEYDTFGDPSSPPLLLIMGAGGQMIMWNEALCDLLASQGLYVIRFDHRDVGLSTWFDEAGELDIMEILTSLQRGEEPNVPYTYDDMAADVIGLLDALGIEKAHILGVSMGGMIAQTIAINYPSRVWSLISMESTTGDPALPQGKPEVWEVLFSPMPTEREAHVEYLVNLFRMMDGSKYPSDEQEIRRLAERLYDRGYHPQGMARHVVAGMVSGYRTEALKSVTAPTLVIQGSEDPFFPIECGRATAEAVPGAELLIIEGLGHGFPAKAWPLLVDAVAAHTRKAGS